VPGGRRGRRGVVRPNVESKKNEVHCEIDREDFGAMDANELHQLADKIGVSMSGATTIEQMRTRLLNDAEFIGV
jgi:hypothetical protein